MIEAIISALSEAVIWTISKLGCAGIVVSMAIESARIPPESIGIFWDLTFTSSIS